jgi:hypothetical protein
MRAAAHGAVDAPPAEVLEILVLLTSNPVFRKQARITLAGWDQGACEEVLRDPAAPQAVLDYFLDAENRRPALLPALVEHPAVPESVLLPITQEHSRDVVNAMLASPRVKSSANLLNALISNPLLTPAEITLIREALEALGEGEAGTTYDYEEELERYVMEHSAEIAAEEGKPFELVRDLEEPGAGLEAKGAREAQASVALEHLSVYQKIARLNVSERVQLAMKGGRDERFILIRDGCKVVAMAVLESPRVSDQEVETYASMKNVQEGVLRGIAGKRKFIKNYAVIRNLANNPRCPLDVQLTLMKNLLNNDLRSLSANKNVADTIRKLAMKMYRERTDKRQSR